MYVCLLGKVKEAGLGQVGNLDGWFVSKAGVKSCDVTCPDMNAKTTTSRSEVRFSKLLRPAGKERDDYREE